MLWVFLSSWCVVAVENRKTLEVSQDGLVTTRIQECDLGSKVLNGLEKGKMAFVRVGGEGECHDLRFNPDQ